MWHITYECCTKCLLSAAVSVLVIFFQGTKNIGISSGFTIVIKLIFAAVSAVELEKRAAAGIELVTHVIRFFFVVSADALKNKINTAHLTKVEPVCVGKIGAPLTSGTTALSQPKQSS